ncbi:shikimate 5-dehydrogenase [Listeria fleischmannii 1991]|uniref:Shikimate dehydrogenase (NADP(+)) n=2 Tax=Listeria fleischmannii TaxID=1069827 RepID=A0A2X3HI43_9LIST|nr:shikimate dehydrogenase [Listeria fleischmannii]EMG28547.1 shikimate 5-dehydrogenase [Listeria fleischmannii subsp. fleischmannii LU2006-1]KMT60510.1 shikimate 5-dehydrogenase [Listeria fleischmannii 1991]SQC71921.1 Shikimate dehydrogenase [Listeria fleischmannii subsp. fleischmannii]
MKNFAVIGNPISHSLSPEMHNAAILDLGIDAHYTRKRLSIEQFDTEFPLFLEKIEGCNVTVPFKERVIPFLDELDDFARKCGAVNTIVRRNSKWVGYNTDGLGYLLGLTEKRALHKNDHVLLIGAGGASKGIYLALKEKVGCQVTVANRTIQKAAEMIRDFENDRAISLDMAEEELGSFTIVIQTTSIGLPKTIDETPISLHHLKPGTICSDIIYNPAKTLFLKEAEKRQAIIQNGLPMFIHQGALAFRLWTGQKPSTDVMKKAVLASL